MWALLIPVIGWALLPLIAWNRVSYAVIVLLFGGPLVFAWLDHFAHPVTEDTDGPGQVLGYALLLLVSWGFAATALVRVIGLALQRRGWPRGRAGLIELAGIGAFALISQLPNALHALDQRDAPSSCLARSIDVQLADIKLTLPQTQLARLYLGTDLRRDARYLRSAKGRRRVCAATRNGERPIEVVAISLDASRGIGSCSQRERGDPLAAHLCRQSQAAEGWPQDVTLFSPGGIRLGQFGIGSYPNAQYECRESGQPGALHCATRQRLSPHVEVHYRFNTVQGAEERDFLRAQQRVQSLTTSLTR